MRRMCDGGVARIAVIGLAGRCQYSQWMAKAGCLSALRREIQRETKMPIAMQTAKDSLAAGQIADEEHEQDRRGDIDIPEADLPLVIETPRDIGVRLHVGLLGVDAAGSDHRAHDRAGDHETHGGEDGEADVEQDRAEVA
jgi:hypothetical protein